MRRSSLPMAAALLTGAALLFQATPGEARLVRPNEPAAPVAERGGQNVPKGAAQGRRACAWGFDAVLLMPFAFGLGLPCLGLPQIEAMTRMAAGVQQALAAEQSEWRAPRLVARAARPPRRDRPREASPPHQRAGREGSLVRLMPRPDGPHPR